jgi:uncharacterized protein with HEPN domain
MSGERSDALYLDHIQERIQRIEECAREGHEAFEASHVLQDAVIRSFEVIGEAVKQLSPALLDRYPEVPWRRIAGFRAADWRQLADALRNQAIESPVADRTQSPHGTRYVIDGPIDTPTNEQPHVRTVWIADRTTTPIIPSSGDGVSTFIVVDPEYHD